jgi:curved DNA-binding protein CbpA
LGSDPYAVLGVARDATDAQIGRARHQLIRKYHPDVNHDPDAAIRFDEVQQAFDLLSDPVARAEFDRTHDEQGRAVDGGYGPYGEAASSVRIEPASVDFGVLTPQRPWADADVTITWTGIAPENITRSTDGEWWRVMGSTRPAWSYMEYRLRAESYSSELKGQQHAQFTVTVCGTVLTVELSAEFQGDFSKVTRLAASTTPPRPAPDGNPQPSSDVQPATINYELVYGVLFLGLLVASFTVATLGIIFHWTPHPRP